MFYAEALGVEIARLSRSVSAGRQGRRLLDTRLNSPDRKYVQVEVLQKCVSDSTTKHLQNPNVGHRAIDPRSALSNYDRPGTISPYPHHSNLSKERSEQEIKKAEILKVHHGRDIAHLMQSLDKRVTFPRTGAPHRPCPDGRASCGVDP